MPSRPFFCLFWSCATVWAAISNGPGKLNTRTTSTCMTKFGTESIYNVPTYRATGTTTLSSIVVTSTLRSTSNVTPRAITIKRTAYAARTTTVAKSASTVTFTTTVLATITFKSRNHRILLKIDTNPRPGTIVRKTTSVATQIVSTYVTTTSTVATIDGFKNIQDTVRSRPPPKRFIELQGSRYPQFVQC